MDKEQADTIAIRQRFQPGDNLIVVSVAVVVPTDFPYLLERVNDNKGSVRMLPQKIGELLVQTAAELSAETEKNRLSFSAVPNIR